MAICDFIAGSVGGITGVIVGHPIDTVKTNQQVYTTSFTGTIRAIFQHHGWRGFFSGMGMPLVTSGAIQSIFFGVYGTTMNALIQRKLGEGTPLSYERPSHEVRRQEAYTQIKHRLKEEPITATYVDYFIAGTTAGFARLISSCPIEVVKVRLQSQIEKVIYKGPFDCALQIYTAQGIRGFFAGAVPLCGRAYGLGFYAVMYEYFKVNIPISNDSTRMFVAGGFAGLLQWWMVIPLDVLKSKLQADDPRKPKYKGVIDCARKMYFVGGYKSFFRGFVPLTIRAFPVNGATFLSYEIAFSTCKRFAKTSAESEQCDSLNKYCK